MNKLSKLYMSLGLMFLAIAPGAAFAISGVPTTIKTDVDLTNTDVVAIGAATLSVSVAVYAYKSVKKVL